MTHSYTAPELRELANLMDHVEFELPRLGDTIDVFPSDHVQIVSPTGGPAVAHFI